MEKSTNTVYVHYSLRLTVWGDYSLVTGDSSGYVRRALPNLSACMPPALPDDSDAPHTLSVYHAWLIGMNIHDKDPTVSALWVLDVTMKQLVWPIHHLTSMLSHWAEVGSTYCQFIVA